MSSIYLDSKCQHLNHHRRNYLNLKDSYATYDSHLCEQNPRLINQQLKLILLKISRPLRKVGLMFALIAQYYYAFKRISIVII